MIKEHKRITQIINKALKELNLKHIKINFVCNNDLCFTLKQNRKQLYTPSIDIDYLMLYTYAKISNKDKTVFSKMFNLNSVSKRIKFILYHELGHYLQYNKHFDFFIKYLKVDNNISELEYRKLRNEHIADRIALYLLNKGI